jgi:hypothetical protein
MYFKNEVILNVPVAVLYSHFETKEQTEFTSVTVHTGISEAIRTICCYDTWLDVDDIDVLSKVLFSSPL